MTGLQYQVTAAFKFIKAFQIEHEENLKVEERLLLEAKDAGDQYAYLKLSGEISVKRALREQKLSELQGYVKELEIKHAKYIEEVRAKTAAAYKIRREEVVKSFTSNNWAKKMIVDNEVQVMVPIDKAYGPADLFFKQKVVGSPGDWREIGRHPNNSNYMVYAMPLSAFIDKHIMKPASFNWRDIQVYKRGAGLLTQREKYDRKNFLIFDIFQNSSLDEAYIQNLIGALTVIQACYPSVNEYIGNEESYPYFIDFMEEVPWPTTEQLDMAIKTWIGLGTQEYAENNLKEFEELAKLNTDPKAHYNWFLDLPPKITGYTKLDFKTPDSEETHYGELMRNPHYRYVDKFKYYEMQPRFGGKHPSAITDQEAIDAKMKVINWQIDREASAARQYNVAFPFAFIEDIKADMANAISYIFLNYKGVYPDPEYKRFAEKIVEKIKTKGTITPANESDWKLWIERWFGLELTHPYVYGVKYSSQTPYLREFEVKGVDSFPISTKPYMSKETAGVWYSPRPKEGHVYVPGFDYVNPLYFTGAHVNQAQTNYGKEQERRLALSRVGGGGGGMFGSFIRSVGAIAINMQKSNSFSKMFSAGMSLMMGTALVAMTGGGAAAMIGVIANTAISYTNLGKSETGQILTKIGQAISIANVSNMAVEEAVREVLEAEAQSILKREVAEETGLDKSIIGRIAVDAGVTAGWGAGVHDKEFFTALSEGSNKAWRIEAAKSDPVAAIIIAGATHIEQKGVPYTNSDDPEDWFNNFSWEAVGEDVANMVKKIDSKDVARAIGIGLMVSSGYISAEDAALLVAQQGAISHIDNIYNDKPVYGPMSQQEMDYRQGMADSNRWKMGINVFKKIKSGEPPTKAEISFMTEDVAGPLYDNIKRLGVPTDFELKLWDTAINDVGMPNIAQYAPDGGIRIPEWMKTKKGDTAFPMTTKEDIEKSLGKKLDMSTNFTKEDFIRMVLAMLPANTPLVPLSRSSVYPSFNWKDYLGNISVRPPLSRPYEHPMTRYGVVKRKYSAKETQYMLAREAEMIAAREKLDKAKELLAQMESGQMPPQMG